MNRWPLLFAFLSGPMIIAVPVSADTPASQPVQVVHTETVDFAPGGTVRLNGSSGDLEVEGWDQPRVEITVVKSMGYDSNAVPVTTRGLESVHVVTGHPSAAELTISTTRDRIHNRFTHALGIGREATVEYHIRVPRNSHLVIDRADGYVSVTGVTGNIEANNRRGDIVLMLPDLAAYSIDAQTKVGVVTSDLAGSTHMKHLLGENFTHGDSTPTHRLMLRMGFGGITIKELPHESLPAAR